LDHERFTLGAPVVRLALAEEFPQLGRWHGLNQAGQIPGKNLAVHNTSVGIGHMVAFHAGNNIQEIAIRNRATRLHLAVNSALVLRFSGQRST
jgi:hypothetical protein